MRVIAVIESCVGDLETRDASARKKTTEISTQTDIIVEDEEFEDESDGKSRHELEEIELELVSISQKIMYYYVCTSF